jgi:hypothetical protein
MLGDPEVIMKGVALAALSIAALATMAGDIAWAGVQEYPTYDCYGFPATPLQLQVIESKRVEERTTPSAVVLDGMPASPHQLAVLHLRRHDTR